MLSSLGRGNRTLFQKGNSWVQGNTRCTFERRKGGDTMMRKDVMIAILVTFCLTVMLFAIIPVGSQGVREYDPWYDVTGPTPGQPDGKIDVRDIYSLSLKYGTTATEDQTTRNVSVTNWPQQYKIGYYLVNMTWINYGSFSWTGEGIDTRGYSKISFFIEPLDMSIDGYWWPNNLTIAIVMLDWEYSLAATFRTNEMVENLNFSIFSHNSWSANPMDANLFDVKGPYCHCNLTPYWMPSAPSSTGWITFQVVWYLRNE